MSRTVSVSSFLAQVERIRASQPQYKLGHDGSDGYCDCIGLIRGALIRAGVKPSGLGGTNQAARSGSIRGLHKIGKASDLQPGQVVLKTRDPDDPDFPLPSKYRKGGAAYSGDLTNYTHIGVVTQSDPLRITHMTSPTAKIDTRIGAWCYAGDLAYISDTDSQEGPKVTAIVYADNGQPVNLRKTPGGSIIDKVPVGAWVELVSSGAEWSAIEYNGKTGYMMTKYLDAANQQQGAGEVVTVTMPASLAAAVVQLADLITAAYGRG